MTWPTTLTINAWTGQSPVTSSVSTQAEAWASGVPQPQFAEYLKPPADVDPADWRDPSVGWGLVLPERPNLSAAELASGEDAPEPIRQLLKARNNAPVFRYQPNSVKRFTFLRNYAAHKDIDIDPSTPTGIADDALPQYL